MPETEWGEQPSCLVRLRDFTSLDPPLERDVFFSSPYRERLARLKQSGARNLFYNRHINLNQGKYLTPAPSELLQISNDAYIDVTGVPIVVVDADIEEVPDGRSRERRLGVHPLNLVLYGPPGTGKTYSVQRRVLDILEGDAVGLSEREVGERYRRYASRGREPAPRTSPRGRVLLRAGRRVRVPDRRQHRSKFRYQAHPPNE